MEARGRSLQSQTGSGYDDDGDSPRIIHSRHSPTRLRHRQRHPRRAHLAPAAFNDSSAQLQPTPRAILVRQIADLPDVDGEDVSTRVVTRTQFKTITRTVEVDGSGMTTMVMTTAAADTSSSTSKSRASNTFVTVDSVASGTSSRSSSVSSTPFAVQSISSTSTTATSNASSSSANLTPSTASASRSSSRSSSARASHSSTSPGPSAAPAFQSATALTTGQVTLIVLACLFALGLILTAFLLYRRRRRKQPSSNGGAGGKGGGGTRSGTLTTDQVGSPTMRRRQEDLGFMEAMGHQRLESLGQQPPPFPGGFGHATLVPGPTTAMAADSMRNPSERIQSLAVMTSPYAFTHSNNHQHSLSTSSRSHPQDSTSPLQPLQQQTNARRGYRTEDGSFYVPRSGSASKIRFSHRNSRQLSESLRRLSQIEIPSVPGPILNRTRQDLESVIGLPTK